MKLKNIIFVLIILTAFKAEAAEQKFKFKKIKFQYRTISTQDTTIRGLDRSKLRRLGSVEGWGMVETIYQSEPGWADDVEIKYYVLMKGEEQKKPVMLAGSIIYIYIKKRPGHVSNIYIPPQAILRYGKIMRVRAELWYNGILQDEIQWPKSADKTQWWNKVKPVYGSLYNRYFTPFEHESESLEEVIKIE